MSRRLGWTTATIRSSRNVSSGWRYKVGAFALASAESPASAATDGSGVGGRIGMAARGPQPARAQAARVARAAIVYLAMPTGFPTPSYFFLSDLGVTFLNGFLRCVSTCRRQNICGGPMRKPRPATYNPAQALNLISNDRKG